MSIGLQRGTVAVEKHNSEWEESAKQTIKRLDALLQGVAVDIQHVGSTAIRGICAKPIIDIVVGVSDFDEILNLSDILKENGFTYRGQDQPDQHLYVCGDEEIRTHHIHVVIYDSEAWNNYLNMRDYLNSHEEDAKAYSELKEKLAEQYAEDRIIYTEKKSNFIKDILIKANREKE